MQAIILAGGRGTRLKTVTEDIIPKPMVLLHDKPLLQYVIDHAIKNGCDNIIICTGHLGHKIQEYIKSSTFGVPIKISHEEEPLGTAGALRLIEKDLEEEFFILYADVFTTIDIKRMHDFHKKKKADVTIAVHSSDHPHDSTIADIDKSGKFRAMIEKPGDEWIKYGNLTQTSLYIARKNVVDFIPKEGPADFAKDVFPKMLKHGKPLFGYKTEEYAKDLGTPERYAKVLELLKK